MGGFISETVNNLETLVNLATVTSIRFQPAGPGGQDSARLTLIGGGDQYLVVAGAEQVAALRAELQRVGAA
jgi:hypothetical protein